MPRPAISIIIPAFNVQDWISRAVDSLKEQTFGDFEVIIVDDGSTDRTPQICDAIATTDDRIRVIHQENSGAARSRNRALDEAQGEYVYFMDADDWAESKMLEEMYSFAKENELQVVVVGFFIDTYYSGEKFFRELRSAPDAIFLDKDSFRRESWKMFDAQLLYAPWNKLYLRDYLKTNDIYFPVTFWDDLPFNLDVLRNVERIGFMDARYYHFLRARAESENTRYRPEMYDKRCEEDAWMQGLYADWGVDSPEIREFLARRHAERLLGCIENVTCKDCSLSAEDIRSAVADILDDPRSREALAQAVPRTITMKIALFPLKQGNVSATLLQSRLISWVKRNSTLLFATFKANR